MIVEALSGEFLHRWHFSFWVGFLLYFACLFVGFNIPHVVTATPYHHLKIRKSKAGGCILGVIAIMIPSWMQEEQLKTATKTILIVQLILTLVPIYHAVVSYIPFNGSFIAFTILNLLFLIGFYIKSR